MHTVGWISSNGYLGRCEGALFAEIPGKVFVSPSHSGQDNDIYATIKRAHSQYGRLDYVRGRLYFVLGIAVIACWGTNVSCSSLQTERRGLPNHGSTVSTAYIWHWCFCFRKNYNILTHSWFCWPIHSQGQRVKTSTGIDSIVNGTWRPCGNEWSRIHKMFRLSSWTNHEGFL